MQSVTPPRLFPTPTHFRVLVLAILLVAVDTLPVFLLGAGAVTIGAEVGFDATGLGYLTAVFFLTAGLLSAPIGRLVESIGWRRAMRINVVGTLVLLLVMAVAIHSMRTLIGLLIPAAFFYGFGNPAANSALAQFVASDRRGVVFGLKHAGIPTSTLLAGLAVPFAILTVGWRWSFVAGAAVAAVVYALIPRSLPSQSAGSDAQLPAPPPLLDAPRLWLLAAAGMFAVVAPSMLGTFTVTAAVAAGISEAMAGLLLSLGGVITMAARLVAGALADRFGWRGFGAMAALLGIGTLAALALAGLSGTPFIVMLLVAFATAWGWPGLMTFSVVRANPATVAASSAVVQGGILVGAGVAPVVIGLIAERASFGAAWTFVAAALLVAAATIGGLARWAGAQERGAA